MRVHNTNREFRAFFKEYKKKNNLNISVIEAQKLYFAIINRLLEDIYEGKTTQLSKDITVSVDLRARVTARRGKIPIYMPVPYFKVKFSKKYQENIVNNYFRLIDSRTKKDLNLDKIKRVYRK